jgi:hypothetical protein
MSHVVTIQTKVHNAHAAVSACQRLNLPMPVQGTAQLDGGEATGLIIHLSGWQYPVVIDTLTGVIRYDSEGLDADRQQQLRHFLQIYVIEKARLACQKKPYAVSGQAPKDNGIKVPMIERGD